jgi:hypothetical protein
MILLDPDTKKFPSDCERKTTDEFCRSKSDENRLYRILYFFKSLAHVYCR